ncbi:2-succinyl-5-enolpyruvyl-6-hydroxy-3-cyclohexene-1-carboxylic-acid synthase [Photobacterium sp. CCB-ST2H9]|uniref:2-succinyl-5-enolpyruvyl-6-hydroxy-3- cyclohexene-1-carboxylic-acid synthase n=1 Tax=Photobacterium sp. CCB-ST2H9 TaxID=2912855 RepID=UPI002002C429|nr:2-succinyl-5-enolpyruvyl-6-hydroxy-3-cyclohexene-1-carboxylic-acid synthase [Photobacterium sp. CCB-ST2H9]UTM59597.1 2-succinyl-5-enolpyruvyl-6-hydroxy-3-cyclohexene-1-carboxylic-acid synthase [Photobacterium sp. CCB-ST2H9]
MVAEVSGDKPIAQAELNRLWSRILLEELTRQGVAHICIAPGSRSTPLTLEADANPKLTLHTHFDERGLGFLALGLAKASGQPVAVVVTSGTAVANLLPAVVEAGLTGEKLVLLTADRPVELVGCGANQAIYQPGLFSSHVTASLELPSPSQNVPLSWLLTSVDALMHRQRCEGGALHLNCPFPEPLYGDARLTEDSAYGRALGDWLTQAAPYVQYDMGKAAPALPPDCSALADGNVVMIAGDLSASDARAVAELAQKLGCPLLCDPQSGISSDWAHYDLWLQHPELAAPLNDCRLILQFGPRLISKRLNQWLAGQVRKGTCDYWYVSPDSNRNNQSHLPQRQMVAEIPDWIRAALAELPADISSQHTNAARNSWSGLTQSAARKIRSLLDEDRTEQPGLTEMALAMDLSQRGQQASLFLGNSLIARLVDMLTVFGGRAVYSNRGASGIDGLVATAAGVQRATGTPLMLMLGDTALLHDLNSLALLSHCTVPVVIVVTNNDGGAIFDLLPVPEDDKQRLYQMPHGYAFGHAARQFGLGYCKAETLAEYQSVVSEHLSSGTGSSGTGALLVEVQTPPGQAAGQLSQLIRRLHAL